MICTHLTKQKIKKNHNNIKKCCNLNQLSEEVKNNIRRLQNLKISHLSALFGGKINELFRLENASNMMHKFFYDITVSLYFVPKIRVSNLIHFEAK